jgi:hypothetical protein
MDESIALGRVTMVQRPWPVLNPAGDRLTVGGHTLLFADLASALQGLWRMAERLSSVRHDPRVHVHE